MKREKEVIMFCILGALVSMGAIGTIIAVAEAKTPEPATVIEGSEELPNDGVIKIPAGDQGHYVWDSRTDLCFFVTKNTHGVVQVPCEPVVKITRNQ